MKNPFKTIGMLVLVVIFLISCVAVLLGGSSALWLHTYNVFTERTPVAEVSVSAMQTDENGPYTNVKLRLITKDSALAALFGQADPEKESLGSEADYKVYGDTLYVSGPIIKFKDPLILINFKTIYKFGKLYGRYDLNNQLETTKNAAAQLQSSYDVNGGYAEWKSTFDNINADNLLGKFYSLFIDTTQISSAGIFIGNSEQKYTVYITNLGFLWQKDE